MILVLLLTICTIIVAIVINTTSVIVVVVVVVDTIIVMRDTVIIVIIVIIVVADVMWQPAKDFLFATFDTGWLLQLHTAQKNVCACALCSPVPVLCHLPHVRVLNYLQHSNIRPEAGPRSIILIQMIKFVWMALQ